MITKESTVLGTIIFKAIKKNGAEVIPVYSGSQTLVDAVSECMRFWVANCDTTAMCVGSTVGPAVFVRICGWSTSQISRELKVQLIDEFGSIPKKLKLYNCVGGGSSSFGFWNEFMDYDKKQCEFIGVEAGGPAKSKKHAAPLTYGSKIGILHGAAQYVNQNSDGQIEETESISAGLDYPGISPLHCFLKDTKRARYTSASDEEALKAYQLVSKLENISPSLEPSHAFAEAIKIAPKLKSSDIIITDSGGNITSEIEEGQTVQLSVDIRNEGNHDALDVDIEVRLDSLNGTLLHSETIDIQANSIQDLEDFSWISEGQGVHKFLVMCIVDSDENEEVRYDNNNASKSLLVRPQYGLELAIAESSKTVDVNNAAVFD